MYVVEADISRIYVKFIVNVSQVQLFSRKIKLVIFKCLRGLVLVLWPQLIARELGCVIHP